MNIGVPMETSGQCDPYSGDQSVFLIHIAQSHLGAVLSVVPFIQAVGVGGKVVGSGTFMPPDGAHFR